MSEPKTKMTLLLTPAERSRLDELRLARGDRHASATLRALVRDAGGDTRAAERALLEPTPPGQRSGKSGPAPHRVVVPPGGASIGGVHVTEPGAYMIWPGLIQPAVFDGPVPYPPDEPDDPGLPEPVDLDVPAARADFLARVGCSPEEYLRRWRAGQIPDTGEGMFCYQRALLLEDSVAIELMELPDRVEAEGRDALLEAIRSAATAAIEAELGSARVADIAARVVQALPRWAGLDPGGSARPDPLRLAHVRGAARAARELADALERIAERA